MHAGSTHRTKDCANTRGKLLGCRQTNPPREAGRQQPEWERGKLSPRDGILHQTVSRPTVDNQDFLGSWMVDNHQEGHSQRSAPQRRHTAHLRWCSHWAPRKPSGWDPGGNKMHHPPGESVVITHLVAWAAWTWEGHKFRPNRVCAFVEYQRTWTA